MTSQLNCRRQYYNNLNKIMEELIFIIEERRHLLNTLSIMNIDKTKAQLLQDERKRNERENWIIRILKTLKFLTIEQKKNVYESIIKIMNYYHQTQHKIDNFQATNYTETIINLFVNFYNKFDNMDLAHIKTIIRPNNNYIVVDLIKSLVQLGRKDFKSAILEHYKGHEIKEKKYSLTAVYRQKLNNKSLTHIDNKYPSNFGQQFEKSTEIGKTKVIIQSKIDEFLNQKYNRVIETFNLQQTYERANQLYYDLFYHNQKNALKIQKYMQSCFGPKKLLNYDISGLYTQQQIKNMIQQQKQKSKNRIQFHLTSNCTAQQFKEYFKIQLQSHQNAYSIVPFEKRVRINPWFPLIIVKNGNKLHPYNIMIQSKGNTYFVNEYEEKFGKKLKQLMKQDLNLHRFTDMLKGRTQNDVNVKIKDYLDFNNAKVIEIINKEPPIIKKQSMFPKINSNELTNDDNSPLKVKLGVETRASQSQKLLPFVRQSNIQKQVGKKLNYSSFMQQMDTKHKSRLDNLIGNILKKRQISFV